MQLFIADYTLTGKEITIRDKDIIDQARKVLRLTKGDQFFLQQMKVGSRATVRHKVQLENYGATMHCSVIEEETHKEEIGSEISMIIAMPNKREKAELIVQKLCEIGVDTIIFRPSERSVIKVWNTKKEERLLKIAKEAVEQSRGRHLPTVTFMSDIHEHLQNNRLVVFDKGGNIETLKSGNVKEGLDRPSTGGLYGLIGPEGGRGPKDYELFKKYTHEVKDLGATVLRMETAAIVGAWVLKNGL